MTTIGTVRQRIEPHGQLHARLYDAPQVNGKYPIGVQVSLNRAAKPGRIAFKRDRSILRSYRLGRLSLAPRWVRDVAALVVASAGAEEVREFLPKSDTERALWRVRRAIEVEFGSTKARLSSGYLDGLVAAEQIVRDHMGAA